MTADIDIWRAAKLLIDRYRDAAPSVAASRAAAMAAIGDSRGADTYRRVVDAIRELQRGRNEGDPVN